MLQRSLECWQDTWLLAPGLSLGAGELVSSAVQQLLCCAPQQIPAMP